MQYRPAIPVIVSSLPSKWSLTTHDNTLNSSGDPSPLNKRYDNGVSFAAEDTQSAILGFPQIVTDVSSRVATSVSTESFGVNIGVQIYVWRDDNITGTFGTANEGWTDSGLNEFNEEKPHSGYVKEFPPGTVTIPGNAGTTADNQYWITITPGASLVHGSAAPGQGVGQIQWTDGSNGLTAGDTAGTFILTLERTGGSSTDASCQVSVTTGSAVVTLQTVSASWASGETGNRIISVTPSAVAANTNVHILAKDFAGAAEGTLSEIDIIVLDDSATPSNPVAVWSYSAEAVTLSASAVVGVWKRAFNSGNSPGVGVEILASAPLVSADQVGSSADTRYARHTLIKSGSTNYRFERTWLQDPHGSQLVSAGDGHYFSSGDFWYGLRLRIDQNDQSSAGVHWFQWHDQPGAGRSPPLSIRSIHNAGQNERLVCRLEKNDSNGGNTINFTLASGTDYIGQTHDYMFNIKWETRTSASGGVGFMHLYIDDDVSGTPTFTHLGQNCHPAPDCDGGIPYWKLGGYASPMQTQGVDGDTKQCSIDWIQIYGSDGNLAAASPPGARPPNP